MDVLLQVRAVVLASPRHVCHAARLIASTLLCACRRLLVNPTYYGLEDATNEGVKGFLTDLIDDTLADLADAGCVEVRAAPPRHALGGGHAHSRHYRVLCGWLQLGSSESGDEEDPNPSLVAASTLGYIASYYYLKYGTPFPAHYRIHPHILTLVHSSAVPLCDRYGTVGLFSSRLGGADDVERLCRLLADAKEFEELPGERRARSCMCTAQP